MITDPELIMELWDNAVPADERVKSMKNRKKPLWKALERLGDAHLLVMARQELPKLFGRANHDIVGFLEDHAKGNKLFEQISKHYKLDRYVRHSPLKEESPNGKDWSDIFEVWVGLHVCEKTMYYGGQGDSQNELRDFIRRLWSLRYRRLFVYSQHQPTHITSSSNVPESKVILREVSFPGDPLLKDVIPPHINSKRRKLGYLATFVQNRTSKADSVSAFGPSKEEAVEMAQVLARISPTMQRNMLTTC
jgi:hypothetical protein